MNPCEYFEEMLAEQKRTDKMLDTVLSVLHDHNLAEMVFGLIDWRKEDIASPSLQSLGITQKSFCYWWERRHVGKFMSADESIPASPIGRDMDGL